MSSLSIGLAIKAIREAKKMTGKELGQLVGVEHYDISRIETGKVRLDFRMATKIAAALHVTLDMIHQQSLKLEVHLASKNTSLAEVTEAKKQLKEVLKDLSSAIPSH